MTTHPPLHTSWQIDEIAQLRDTHYAASQRKFVPFKEPMVFKKGSMQYLWDVEGRKYTDLLGMNVCISVGHSHPKVVAAATRSLTASSVASGRSVPRRSNCTVPNPTRPSREIVEDPGANGSLTSTTCST